MHCLLLAGLAQIDAIELSPHAAVGATAEAARDLGKTALVGLVNALLRRATREPLPAGADAGRTQLASGLVGRRARARLARHSSKRSWPRTTSRRRCGCGSIRARSIAWPTRNCCVDPEGCTSLPPFPAQSLRIDAHLSPELMPGWQDGSVAVQDGAAQLAAEALAVTPRERVLDACAAPGGKSAQIAEVLDGGSLLALDVDERRLRKVRNNLRRLGLESPAVVLRVADGTLPATWWDGEGFDAILLDAPCSATGIIRRQPDIKWHRQESDLPALMALQARLLDALWTTLRPGGRFLYATCSVLKDENETQVAAFLARTADAVAGELDARFGHASGAGRQRLPGEDGMDGFFYALLHKRA